MKNDAIKPGIIPVLKSALNRETLMKPVNPVAAVCTAFIVAGLVVWVTGGNPIEAYGALFSGAFGSQSGLINTIRYTLPIVMLGFSFAICFKCGYFNIGQEGQMYAAALMIAGVQAWLPEAPNGVLLPLMLLAAIAAGGLVCLIPAILKFLFGVNEIIVAMLANYIIVLLTNYLLMYSPIAQTGKSAAMSIAILPTVDRTVLFLAAIAIILAYALCMKNSVPGYRLRIVGFNENFARASGIDTIKLILIVSFLGGAFSALSASGEILGEYHRIYTGFARNLGFYGMTAALIGSRSTIGLVLGALILGALQSGSVSLSVKTDVPSELVLVVQGFVMLFATINILQYFMKPTGVRR